MADSSKFKIVRKGYSTYEVDETFRHISNENEELKNQLENCRLLLEQANQQLSEVKEKYSKLTGQIEIREKAADDISRLALKEANRIILSAQNNADSIVNEALSTAKMILNEIARLSDEANDAKVDMQSKLDELQKVLDAFEIPETIDRKWLKD